MLGRSGTRLRRSRSNGTSWDKLTPIGPSLEDAADWVRRFPLSQKDLRDLAAMSSADKTWCQRVAEFRDRYSRKSSLMKRFDAAGFPTESRRAGGRQDRRGGHGHKQPAGGRWTGWRSSRRFVTATTVEDLPAAVLLYTAIAGPTAAMLRASSPLRATAKAGPISRSRERLGERRRIGEVRGWGQRATSRTLEAARLVPRQQLASHGSRRV